LSFRDSAIYFLSDRYEEFDLPIKNLGLPRVIGGIKALGVMDASGDGGNKNTVNVVLNEAPVVSVMLE